MTFKPIQLPEDIVNEILQYSQVIDTNYWHLGDIGNKIYFILKNTYSKSDCASLVAYYAKWKQSTVQDQMWMCEQIPRAKREYELSRHQYRACLAAGEKWEEYAKKAEEYADQNGGHTATCALIRKWIDGYKDAPPVWEKRWNKLLELAEAIAKDDQAREDVREICQNITSQTSKQPTS